MIIALRNAQITGEPYSQTNGFYYQSQPWYEESIGRFVSRNPVPGSVRNPQGSNSYAYALNLPTVLTDPSGGRSEYETGQPTSTSCSSPLGGPPEAKYTLTATEELFAGQTGLATTFERPEIENMELSQAEDTVNTPPVHEHACAGLITGTLSLNRAPP